MVDRPTRPAGVAQPRPTRVRRAERARLQREVGRDVAAAAAAGTISHDQPVTAGAAWMMTPVQDRVGSGRQRFTGAGRR
jgi:hypothetical protein